MKLRSKISLVLGGAVLVAVVLTSAVQSRFFTLDQETYLIEMQTMLAQFAAKQLNGRMTLLYTQVGELLDAGRDLPTIAKAIPACVGASLGAPEEIVDGRIWGLKVLSQTAEGPAIVWEGRYPKQTVFLTFAPVWFSNMLEASHGVKAQLVERDGTVVLEEPARTDEAILGTELFHNRRVLGEMFSLPVGTAVARRYYALDGTRELTTFLPLGSDPELMIAVTTPWHSIDAVIARTYRQSFWAGITFLLLAIALAALFARTLIAPLEALVEATGELARGGVPRLAAEVSEREDELGKLARAFGSMSQELSKARETVRHTERLAAFGKFSSSIAHEIRNPLSSILGNTQVARRALGSPEELETVRGALEFVEEETRRANRIINRLMRFARQDQRPSAVIDLVERVQRSLAIIEPLVLEKGVQLEVKLVPRSLFCLADGDQMHEVLLNLIENALYAVKDAPEKKIRVSLEERGGEAVLKVTDTGIGIEASAREHLFEPFFTTKSVGEGTGLGLAVCHGIVTNHGGRIEANSEPGRGAELVISLPLARAEGEAALKAA